ncbi:MAG: bifunctional folylpolyglutamate synthase/dihydrofolate synthase [Actinobacteria bacterium]|nr:bifunctional folylpolyglutamate synthase/dihydrofolate synthase [Actinomycetota bacterium]
MELLPDGSGREAAQPSPDDYLDSLEPVGWRLGLDRMWKLTTALGLPQRRFASVHVVGTNGKSSVTRMVAALLEAHGVSSGACLSPHASRWTERTLIRGEEISAQAWAEAVAQVAAAAAGVNPTLEEDDAVSEFEAATAATFVALARARVKAAVIEAGLGGRLDATNTIPSRVTVLTSVGLDHTEWLGETELEIAAEKLAVLRDHSTLVLGRVSAAVRALAERIAGERGAALIVAPEDPGREIELAATGSFQRRNFALAVTAAEAFLGAVDPERVAPVAAGLRVPGRLELIAAGPPTYVDAAHNPDGAAALAEALPEIAKGRPVVACLAMLADKDAAAMIAALAPALRSAVCTEIPPAALAGHGRPGARSRPARELVDLCRAQGLEAIAEPRLEPALRRATELAAGTLAGVLLITGSHYLIAPARALQGAPAAPPPGGKS